MLCLGFVMALSSYYLPTNLLLSSYYLLTIFLLSSYYLLTIFLLSSYLCPFCVRMLSVHSAFLEAKGSRSVAYEDAPRVLVHLIHAEGECGLAIDVSGSHTAFKSNLQLILLVGSSG